MKTIELSVEVEKSTNEYALYDYTLERDEQFELLKKALKNQNLDDDEVEDYFISNAELESRTEAHYFYNQTISRKDINVIVDDKLNLKVENEMFTLHILTTLDEMYNNEAAKELVRNSEE